MTTVILTIHTLIVLALIGVVLLQRSEGGALGMGGGGGGGFMTGRGAANALTRTTSILAALFFATSLALAMISGGTRTNENVIKDLTGQPAEQQAPQPNEAPSSVNDLLKSLGSEKSDQNAPQTGQDVLNAIPQQKAPAESSPAPASNAAPESEKPESSAPASGEAAPQSQGDDSAGSDDNPPAKQPQ